MKRLDTYWDTKNIVSLVLLPVSSLFRFISAMRRTLYMCGIFQTYRAPLPVIIIGNITVGGTGKTPLIIELVKQLQLLGKKPGVISRGYGGQANSWPQCVNAQSDALQVGDEPQMIFNQTACPIVVGPNRKQDIELLLKQFDCDVILSDDGLQHYALQREYEIVVVDALKQFGNGYYLPAGPLREGVNRLQQVDMVLFNGVDEPALGFKMKPTRCVSMDEKAPQTVGLEYFAGKKAHVVAGIGHPARFFTMLSEYNVEVIPHAFDDHYVYDQSDIIFTDEHCVLMTEKDAVKCRHFNLSNHWSVSIDISLTTSAQHQLNAIFASLD